MGNLANLLTNPSSAIETQKALVEAVLLDEAANTVGTVTSVALTMPGEFAVAGSPVTDAGTLAVTKATQAANKAFCGPATGSAAAPTFRSLVAADLPAATTAAFGAVKPDNATLDVSGTGGTLEMTPIADVAGTYTAITSITIDGFGRVTAITGT